MFYLNLTIETEERYDLAKFFEYNIDNYDPLNSFLVKQLNNLSTFGQYIVTVEEFRPDLISYKIYNTTQYWWLLMFYNNILSYTDVVSGVVIIYPAIKDLEKLYFQLKELENVQT